MTKEQLDALAVYRTHKYCQCSDCKVARVALKDYDSQPRITSSRHEGGDNANSSS